MHGLEHWQELDEVWIYRGMAVWCLEGGRGKCFSWSVIYTYLGND